MKFVVYEVWTKARIIEADDYSDAYVKGEPEPLGDESMSLCNWHVVAADGTPEPELIDARTVLGDKMFADLEEARKYGDVK